MFKDYYAILEIHVSATDKEIQAAFKKQALKWHPDRNLGQDTTIKMQNINEAKLILLDVEARERYDTEYIKFKKYQQQKDQTTQNQSEDFEIQDEILNKWMNNAKKQAVDLAKETIEDFKAMAKEGMKAAADKVGSQIDSLLIVAAILLIITILIKISRVFN